MSDHPPRTEALLAENESLLRRIAELELESRRAQAHAQELHRTLDAALARQESLLASIPDIVMEVDTNKVYTWANQPGLDFFGSEVIGKPAADYFEGVQDTYESVQALFAGDEQTFRVESWQRRRDGEKRLLSWWCRVLKGEGGDVTGAISTARDVTDERRAITEILKRQRAEEALRASEAQLSQALRIANAGHWEYEVATDTFTFNDNFYRIFRTSAQEVGGYTLSSADYARRFCHPDDAVLVGKEVRASIETTDPDFNRQIEHRILYANGEVGHIAVRHFVVKDPQGRTIRTYGVNQDITERVRLEEERHRLAQRTQQAQKLEALGQLAGGIAHDFGNALSIILNDSEFLLDALPEGSPLRPDAQEIHAAVEHAAALVGQLLAFSRHREVELQDLDVNQTVGRLTRMLARTLGEQVRIETRLDPEAGFVRLDPAQLEQIVLNLALNARDAMPLGGTLTLSTGVLEIAVERPVFGDRIPPGRYVVLSVQDTGVGIPAGILGRIFEPFFTTKARGEGTGMGLAMVHGAVRQGGGHIEVDSDPGKGSAFRLYFKPVLEGVPVSPRPQVAACAKPGERILLVEDDDQVRRAIARILRLSGFEIAEARDGLEALALYQAAPVRPDLVLTDAIMPRLGGGELARRIRALAPRQRIIFVSGYHEQPEDSPWGLAGRVVILRKPVERRVLLRRIRETLDDVPARPDDDVD